MSGNRTKTPTIAIIGGGLGGIAVGVRLKKEHIDSFVIFESESGPGGTWWINRYPGCEVDVRSEMYSYSFGKPRWTRTHARQSELLAYIQRTLDENDLNQHFRYSAEITHATWFEDAPHWELTTGSGEKQRFDIVVSAVGTLSNPNIPEWAQHSPFKGAMFHTARWDQEFDLAGKTVAVVGVGLGPGRPVHRSRSQVPLHLPARARLGPAEARPRFYDKRSKEILQQLPV
jgi:cation diffusion facilitator CzcD-associated flavoprotein CzcO